MKKSPRRDQHPRQEAQNGPKGPSRRRIMRKDRRQTLEVLTSDDEVNDFIEARPSAYIEPAVRRRLHEMKPHLRSSYETLYNPQFDAPPDSAARGALGGSCESLDSLSDDAGPVQAAANTAAPTSAPASAANVANGPVKEERPDRPSVASLTGSAVKSPVMPSASDNSGRTDDSVARSAAQDQMDRLANEILLHREARLAAADAVDGARGQFPVAARPPNDFSHSHRPPASPTDEAARRSLSRKAVAFRLPEEATLMRLRARIGGGGNGFGGQDQAVATVNYHLHNSRSSSSSSSGSQPQSAAEKLRLARGQPVRADRRVAMSQPVSQPVSQPAADFRPDTNGAAEAAGPGQPSVTQQLRALLPAGHGGDDDATAKRRPTVDGGFNAGRHQQPSPSAQSVQLASPLSADRHAPRRTNSLMRSGSYSHSAGSPVNSRTVVAASAAVALQPTGPVRRTWSVLQQQKQHQHQPQQLDHQHQYQQFHYQQHQNQQHRQQDLHQRNHRQQQQPEPQTQPPPLPPRRRTREAVAAMFSINMQLAQKLKIAHVVDLPSVDHVFKRIVLTPKEAERHRLIVTSSHYRVARAATSMAQTSDRHRPSARLGVKPSLPP